MIQEDNQNENNNINENNIRNEIEGNQRIIGELGNFSRNIPEIKLLIENAQDNKMNVTTRINIPQISREFNIEEVTRAEPPSSMADVKESFSGLLDIPGMPLIVTTTINNIINKVISGNPNDVIPTQNEYDTALTGMGHVITLKGVFETTALLATYIAESTVDGNPSSTINLITAISQGLLYMSTTHKNGAASFVNDVLSVEITALKQNLNHEKLTAISIWTWSNVIMTLTELYIPENSGEGYIEWLFSIIFYTMPLHIAEIISLWVVDWSIYDFDTVKFSTTMGKILVAVITRSMTMTRETSTAPMTKLVIKLGGGLFSTFIDWEKWGFSRGESGPANPIDYNPLIREFQLDNILQKNNEGAINKIKSHGAAIGSNVLAALGVSGVLKGLSGYLKTTGLGKLTEWTAQWAQRLWTNKPGNLRPDAGSRGFWDFKVDDELLLQGEALIRGSEAFSTAALWVGVGALVVGGLYWVGQKMWQRRQINNIINQGSQIIVPDEKIIIEDTYRKFLEEPVLARKSHTESTLFKIEGVLAEVDAKVTAVAKKKQWLEDFAGSLAGTPFTPREIYVKNESKPRVMEKKCINQNVSHGLSVNSFDDEMNIDSVSNTDFRCGTTNPYNTDYTDSTTKYRLVEKVVKFSDPLILNDSKTLKFTIYSNGFVDPQSVFFNFEVKNNNMLNYLQIDSSPQSFIKRVTFSYKSQIIEQINNYDLIANLHNDMYTKSNNYAKNMKPNKHDLCVGTQEVLIEPSITGTDKIFNPPQINYEYLECTNVNNGLLDFTPSKTRKFSVPLFSYLFGRCERKGSSAIPLYLYKGLEIGIDLNEYATFVPVFKACIQDLISANIDNKDFEAAKSIFDEISKTKTLLEHRRADATLDKFARRTRKITKNSVTVTKSDFDGDCLYKAIASSIYGDSRHHPTVKKMIIDFMTENAAAYKQKIKLLLPSLVQGQQTQPNMIALKDINTEFGTDENSAFNKYINHISEPLAYGGTIEILAFSELTRTPVEIYDSAFEFSHTLGGKMENPPIMLQFSGPANAGHFDLLQHKTENSLIDEFRVFGVEDIFDLEYAKLLVNQNFAAYDNADRTTLVSNNTLANIHNFYGKETVKKLNSMMRADNFKFFDSEEDFILGRLISGNAVTDFLNIGDIIESIKSLTEYNLFAEQMFKVVFNETMISQRTSNLPVVNYLTSLDDSNFKRHINSEINLESIKIFGAPIHTLTSSFFMEGTPAINANANSSQIINYFTTNRNNIKYIAFNNNSLLQMKTEIENELRLNTTDPNKMTLVYKNKSRIFNPSFFMRLASTYKNPLELLRHYMPGLFFYDKDEIELKSMLESLVVGVGSSLRNQRLTQLITMKVDLRFFNRFRDILALETYAPFDINKRLKLSDREILTKLRNYGALNEGNIFSSGVGGVEGEITERLARIVHILRKNSNSFNGSVLPSIPFDETSIAFTMSGLWDALPETIIGGGVFAENFKNEFKASILGAIGDAGDDEKTLARMHARWTARPDNIKRETPDSNTARTLIKVSLTNEDKLLERASRIFKNMQGVAPEILLDVINNELPDMTEFVREAVGNIMDGKPFTEQENSVLRALKFAAQTHDLRGVTKNSRGETYTPVPARVFSTTTNAFTGAAAFAYKALLDGVYAPNAERPKTNPRNIDLMFSQQRFDNVTSHENWIQTPVSASAWESAAESINLNTSEEAFFTGHKSEPALQETDWSSLSSLTGENAMMFISNMHKFKHEQWAKLLINHQLPRTLVSDSQRLTRGPRKFGNITTSEDSDFNFFSTLSNITNNTSHIPSLISFMVNSGSVIPVLNKLITTWGPDAGYADFTEKLYNSECDDFKDFMNTLNIHKESAVGKSSGKQFDSLDGRAKSKEVLKVYGKIVSALNDRINTLMEYESSAIISAGFTLLVAKQIQMICKHTQVTASKGMSLDIIEMFRMANTTPAELSLELGISGPSELDDLVNLLKVKLGRQTTPMPGSVSITMTDRMFVFDEITRIALAIKNLKSTIRAMRLLPNLQITSGLTIEQIQDKVNTLTAKILKFGETLGAPAEVKSPDAVIKFIMQMQEFKIAKFSAPMARQVYEIVSKTQPFVSNVLVSYDSLSGQWDPEGVKIMRLVIADTIRQTRVDNITEKIIFVDGGKNDFITGDGTLVKRLGSSGYSFQTADNRTKFFVGTEIGKAYGKTILYFRIVPRTLDVHKPFKNLTETVANTITDFNSIQRWVKNRKFAETFPPSKTNGVDKKPTPIVEVNKTKLSFLEAMHDDAKIEKQTLLNQLNTSDEREVANFIQILKDITNDGIGNKEMWREYFSLTPKRIVEIENALVKTIQRPPQSVLEAEENSVNNVDARTQKKTEQELEIDRITMYIEEEVNKINLLKAMTPTDLAIFSTNLYSEQMDNRDSNITKKNNVLDAVAAKERLRKLNKIIAKNDYVSKIKTNLTLRLQSNAIKDFKQPHEQATLNQERQINIEISNESNRYASAVKAEEERIERKRVEILGILDSAARTLATTTEKDTQVRNYKDNEKKAFDVREKVNKMRTTLARSQITEIDIKNASIKMEVERMATDAAERKLNTVLTELKNNIMQVDATISQKTGNLDNLKSVLKTLEANHLQDLLDHQNATRVSVDTATTDAEKAVKIREGEIAKQRKINDYKVLWTTQDAQIKSDALALEKIKIEAAKDKLTIKQLENEMIEVYEMKTRNSLATSQLEEAQTSLTAAMLQVDEESQIVFDRLTKKISSDASQRKRWEPQEHTPIGRADSFFLEEDNFADSEQVDVPAERNSNRVESVIGQNGEISAWASVLLDIGALLVDIVKSLITLDTLSFVSMVSSSTGLLMWVNAHLLNNTKPHPIFVEMIESSILDANKAIEAANSATGGKLKTFSEMVDELNDPGSYIDKLRNFTAEYERVSGAICRKQSEYEELNKTANKSHVIDVNRNYTVLANASIQITELRTEIEPTQKIIHSVTVKKLEILKIHSFVSKPPPVVSFINNLNLNAIYVVILNNAYKLYPTYRKHTRYNRGITSMGITINTLKWPQNMIAGESASSHDNEQFVDQLGNCINLERSSINRLNFALENSTTMYVTKKLYGEEDTNVFNFSPDTNFRFKFEFGYESEILGKSLFAVNLRQLNEEILNPISMKNKEIKLHITSKLDEFESRPFSTYDMYIIGEHWETISLDPYGQINKTN